MNMMDTIIGIVIIGIITTFFSFVPVTTMENMNDANKVINYTDLLDEISYRIEQINWDNYSTDGDRELKVLELINQSKQKEKNYLGENYEVKGEVVKINEKKFIKVWIRDKKIYQEYFFGI